MESNVIILITIAIIIIAVLVAIIISKKKKPTDKSPEILEQIKPDTEFDEKSKHILGRFKQDAEFLFRYGNPGKSKELFDTISSDDQKRLLYIAYIEGDSDVRGVAEYFAKDYFSGISDLSQFARFLTTEDRVSIIKSLPVDSRMKKIHQQRITIVLSGLYPHICMLDKPFAFWVLIPKNNDMKEIIIGDTHFKGKQNVSINVLLSGNYVFQVDTELALEKEMAKCVWVLHIHNHTGDPRYIQAGHDDINYVNSWKVDNPNIAKKMLFFLVEKNIVIEYDEKSTYRKRWELLTG